MHDLVIILTSNFALGNLFLDNNVEFNMHNTGVVIIYSTYPQPKLKYKDILQVLGHHTLLLNLHVNLHEVCIVCSYIHITSKHTQLQVNKFSIP